MFGTGRRRSALGVLLACTLVLAACGNSGDKHKTPQADGAPTTTETTGGSVDTTPATGVGGLPTSTSPAGPPRPASRNTTTPQTQLTSPRTPTPPTTKGHPTVPGTPPPP